MAIVLCSFVSIVFDPALQKYKPCQSTLTIISYSNAHCSEPENEHGQVQHLLWYVWLWWWGGGVLRCKVPLIKTAQTLWSQKALRGFRLAWTCVNRVEKSIAFLHDFIMLIR